MIKSTDDPFVLDSLVLFWRRIFNCLTPADRRQSAVVLLCMVAMALFEVLGVASILPFITVLADPTVIQRQHTLARIYAMFGFSDLRTFLLALGLASFVILVVAALVRVGSMFVQNRFIQNCRHSIGCRLLSCYLSQPYEFFLNRHTGDLGKNILSEVDLLVERALLPLGTAISQALVLTAMIGFLVLVNPLITVVAATVLISAYALVFRLTGRVLQRLGHRRAVANRTRFETATEALGGIKTLKVLGREPFYLQRFAVASDAVASTLSISGILGQVPKYVVETLAFGGIMLGAVAVLWLKGPRGDLSSLLPALSLYAFAGYKMLPAIQGIYGSVASLQFAMAAVDTVAREFEVLQAKTIDTPDVGTLRMEHQLELRDVSYTYPQSDSGISHLSFVLKKGESMGIVGRTGSGKTTLADVILGLLVPQSGEILADGKPIDDSTRRSWQRNLGYVPQDIFLSDASLAENIAFGIPPDLIDLDRVVEAARSAHIHEFIVSSLPLGYATEVGERGVRLSGGQKQRIGIARALYNSPDVIMLDEATSALDSLTEEEVMEAIGGLSGKRTVIAIAHRISTLKTCNKIIRLEAGRLVDISHSAN